MVEIPSEITASHGTTYSRNYFTNTYFLMCSKDNRKIKIEMSLTNSLWYQNGVFEGRNGFNAFSCEILLMMENFCHIGKDKY